ncbi:hypothetical protein L1887_03230 [Cichorium endivia]|nr:hypothetical protein L1887_03230 [Cichorium endivia]
MQQRVRNRSYPKALGQIFSEFRKSSQRFNFFFSFSFLFPFAYKNLSISINKNPNSLSHLSLSSRIFTEFLKIKTPSNHRALSLLESHLNIMDTDDKFVAKVFLKDIQATQ